MQRPRSLRSIALARLIAAVALTAAAFGVSSVFAGGPTVSIGSLTLDPSEQGQVSVRALGLSGSGLGAWTVDITYDPAIVRVDNCAAQQNGLCNPAYNETTIRTNGVQLYGLTGDVTLANIVLSCVTLGSTDLTLTLSVFADSTPGSPQPISAAVQNGHVSCVEAPPTPAGVAGDVDCDRDVDPIDAALVLQYDAGLIHTLDCFSNGDLSHDGHVNSIDGSIILQISAGLIH